MDMTMESCRKFVEVLASDAPAPGGGGAAALVGFCHLMRKTDSLEKTLMLGKIEGKRRRG